MLGRFGCDEERPWPVSFGQNEKRGMDDEEFEKYLMNSIVPLFPHAKDKEVHRILIKVNSGPGRLFGGIDRETNLQLELGAFQKGFT